MTALYFFADELSNVARSFLTFYDRMASKNAFYTHRMSHIQTAFHRYVCAGDCATLIAL